MSEKTAQSQRPAQLLWRILPVVAAIAGFAIWSRRNVERPTLGPENHSWFGLDKIWTPEEADMILRMVEERGNFTTFVKDSTSLVEDIGEAEPILPDNRCANSFLVPSTDKTRCVFAQRIDVGRHFLLHGGYSARREFPDVLTSRLLSFQHIFHGQRMNLTEMPWFAALFESPRYREPATAACEGRPVFDPIQMSVIMQLPGQEVPMHFDIPWMHTAHRFNLPQWLLVVMDRSGLWRERRIPQIQGVAYVHRWEPTEADGGGFFFFPKGPTGPVEVFPPKFNTAIVLDGSVVAHGTVPFRPHLSHTVPRLSKDQRHELIYRGDHSWDVLDGARNVMGTFKTDDFRISLVWRTRCFKDEAEKDAWYTGGNGLGVEEVLDTLVADLRKRGVLSPSEPRPAPAALMKTLLDFYVNYPVLTESSTLVPINYCAAPLLAPSWLQGAVRALLTPLCGKQVWRD